MLELMSDSVTNKKYLFRNVKGITTCPSPDEGVPLTLVNEGRLIPVSNIQTQASHIWAWMYDGSICNNPPQRIRPTVSQGHTL